MGKSDDGLSFMDEKHVLCYIAYIVLRYRHAQNHCDVPLKYKLSAQAHT